MKKLLLLLIVLPFLGKSQSYCNQLGFIPTTNQTYTTNGQVTCCTMERVLVCPGTSTSSPIVVADTIYSSMAHRIFLNTNTLLYLKNPNNMDTIFMKGNSVLSIKGTMSGTITVVMESSANITNNNSSCVVNTLTCSSITSPSVGCPAGSSIKENSVYLSRANIYPNPANSNITIESGNGMFNEASISITNILGEVVYVKNAVSAKKVNIDLNTLQSGVYYVTVNSKDAKEVKKIVVSK